MKYLPAREAERIRGLVRSVGLADHIPESIDTEGILAKIGTDKKKEGETVHFVLLKKIGTPFINGSVDDTLIRETIEELKQ